MSHQDRIQDGVFIEGKVILFEDGHAFVGAHRDRTCSGVDVAGDDFEEGRFACAVGTDDAVAVAGCELEIYVVKQDALAKLEGYIGYGQHGFFGKSKGLNFWQSYKKVSVLPIIRRIDFSCRSPPQARQEDQPRNTQKHRQ